MIDAKWQCLKALDEFTRPDGEFCVPFAPLERQTGFERRVVRRHVRGLARDGLAQYFKGLWTEDGEPAGAGYCITEAGVHLLTNEAIP